MLKIEGIALYLLLLCGTFAFPPPAHAADAAKTRNSCVACHSRLPGSSFVGVKSHSWSGSIHQKHGVTCDKCHGGNPGVKGREAAHAGVLGSADPKSRIYFKNIPSTCGACHGAEFYKFTQSLHYKMLESTGRGPECVTCHGSMVTGILTPDTVAAVCEQCHNDRMGIFPYVPQKAKAVLLLLTESSALLDAREKLSRSGIERAGALLDARAALHSARLDWHKFDLDTIIADLQETYRALQKKPGQGRHR
jgi:Cytochrome c7 and related cytochrome c